jgi:hypothetical protein
MSVQWVIIGNKRVREGYSCCTCIVYYISNKEKCLYKLFCPSLLLPHFVVTMPLLVLWDHQAVLNNCLHIHQQNVGFCLSSILVPDLPMGGENAGPNMFEGATKNYSLQRFARGLHKTQNLPRCIMMVVCDCRWIAMEDLIVVRCFHVGLATRGVLCTFFVANHSPIMPRSITAIRRMCPETLSISLVLGK